MIPQSGIDTINTARDAAELQHWLSRAGESVAALNRLRLLVCEMVPGLSLTSAPATIEGEIRTILYRLRDIESGKVAK